MEDPARRSNRSAAQRTGDDAEDLVAARLRRSGWGVLGRNVRIGRNELDIIAVDPGPPRELVIVEVRFRRSRAYGLAEDTIDRAKRGRLRAAVGRLLDERLAGRTQWPRLPIRVDLVVVEPAPAPGGDLRIRHHRAIAL
ncbi:MAG TPA: YraN family protein [Patescibacteria group bacterium]|nr:YraN family protein [Patescibacteria group bacterium]